MEAASHLCGFLRSKGMPQAVSSICQEHVESFIAHLPERWKPATASNKFRAIQQLFKWLADEGEIKLVDMTGSLDGNTGNGRIEVTDYSGDMVMNSENGSNHMRDASGSFNLNSSNGAISLTGAEGVFQLNSGNCKVTVEFVSTPSVRLDLEIEDEREGDIRNSLDVAVAEESDRHLVGTVGDSDSLLRIRTGRSDIVFKVAARGRSLLQSKDLGSRHNAES